MTCSGNSSRDVIALMGPTASGKTGLAIELAKILPVTLISVDSAMVYRGLNIGTAKPSASVLRHFPHALVDICDPATSYSVANFLGDADALVSDALSAGRIPLLVGGTMLYFKAFLQGMAELPVASAEIRQSLAEQAAHSGWLSLYRELQRVDPQAAEKIHPNNIQRLQRALEVYRCTGEPISWWWQQQKSNSAQQRHACRYWQFSLQGLPRAELHRRIEVRFRRMLEEGLVQEVEALRARSDLTLEMPSMRAVGYRQVWNHLAGRLGYAEMIQQALAATRQLAKRQFTWLRGWEGLEMLDVAHPGLPEVVLKKLQRVPIVEDCTGGH